MTQCNHASWFSFQGEPTVSLRHTSVLSDMVAKMDAPAQTWPSLVLLTGTVGKAPLGRMLPKGRSGRREQGGTCLQIDRKTASSDFPLLIAHCRAPKAAPFAPEHNEPICHTASVEELSWSAEEAKETTESLSRRLIYPFVDVICIFMAKGRSLDQLAEDMIAYWELEHASAGFSSSHPRFLFVLSTSDARSRDSLYDQVLRLLRELPSPPDDDFLARISFHAERNIDSTLNARIRAEADQSRSRRARDFTLWNAVHFDCLFRGACAHFARAGREPFNPIIATRLHRPVSSNLQMHLTELLAHANSHTEMTDFVGPYVAECLWKDNYTFDVHGMCPFYSRSDDLRLTRTRFQPPRRLLGALQDDL